MKIEVGNFVLVNDYGASSSRFNKPSVALDLIHGGPLDPEIFQLSPQEARELGGALVSAAAAAEAME